MIDFIDFIFIDLMIGSMIDLMTDLMIDEVIDESHCLYLLVVIAEYSAPFT